MAQRAPAYTAFMGIAAPAFSWALGLLTGLAAAPAPPAAAAPAPAPSAAAASAPAPSAAAAPAPASSAAAAPAPAAAAVAAPPSPADFPPADARLWAAARRSALSRRAAAALQAPIESLEAVRDLLAGQDPRAAIDRLLRVAAERPALLPRLLDASLIEAITDSRIDRDLYRGQEDDDPLVAAAPRLHALLGALPREQAALTELALLQHQQGHGRSSEARKEAERRLASLPQRLAGTQAALLAEAEGIAAEGDAGVAALEAFAAAHPRTLGAARALHRAVLLLGASRPERGEPTERLLRAVALVERLRGGAFPPCAWVERAPAELLGELRLDASQVAPANVPRVIEALRRVLRGRLVLDDPSPLAAGVGYRIASTVTELLKGQPDPAAARLRFLDGLVRDGADGAAVRYLTALLELQEGRRAPAEQVAARERARARLQALADGKGRYARKALATLTAQAYEDGEPAAALAACRRFLSAYGDSDWAWVAALRAGLLLEASGDQGGAAAAYDDAARRPGAPALALGATLAGRAQEALGDFDAALARYRRGLAAFAAEPDARYRIERPAAPKDAAGPGGAPRRAEVVAIRHALAARAAELERTLALPGGAQLERGRYLLSQRRWDEARAALEELLGAQPRSPAAAEARPLRHRAMLEAAIARADRDGVGGIDDAAAEQALAALAREPLDFSVLAADLARGALALRRGEAARARALTRDALARWQRRQGVETRAQAAPTALERDVAALRDLAFRPRGDGPFAGTRWQRHLGPVRAPYLLTDAEITVLLPGQGSQEVRLRRPVPGLPQALLLSNEELDTLEHILVALGGTERRQPRGVMEVPNQPAGAVIDIAKLWSAFFPLQPGHWQGWVLRAYPSISRIDFLDAERGRARIHVTIGYQGTVLSVVREGQGWRVTGFSGDWIT